MTVEATRASASVLAIVWIWKHVGTEMIDELSEILTILLFRQNVGNERAFPGLKSVELKLD